MESGVINEQTHTVARFRVTLERELRVGPDQMRNHTIEEALQFLTQQYLQNAATEPVVELISLSEATVQTVQTVVQKATTIPEAETVLNQRAVVLGVEEKTSEN